jgi:hypothetical protein
MPIIKKTAFCSNKTCCPEISIDTDANTVTITDDFDGTVTLNRGLFLAANFFVRKLNEKRLEVSGSATFRELEYSVGIVNRDGVYLLSLEHQKQKVEGITLKQWNALADAVWKSYDPIAETEALGLYELQEQNNNA